MHMVDISIHGSITVSRSIGSAI